MKNLLHPLIVLPIFAFLLTIGMCIAMGMNPPADTHAPPMWVMVMIVMGIPQVFYLLGWVGYVENQVKKGKL